MHSYLFGTSVLALDSDHFSKAQHQDPAGGDGDDDDAKLKWLNDFRAANGAAAAAEAH